MTTSRWAGIARKTAAGLAAVILGAATAAVPLTATAAETEQQGSHRPGKAASPVTLSTDTKDTVTGGTHVCAGRKLLYHGHVDGPYVSRNGDGDLTVMAVDGSEVLDSDDVCMRLGPDSFNGKEVSRMVVPDDPNLSFLGQPGTILWHAPAQLYDGWKPIWAGFGAFDPGHEWNVPDDFVSNTLELELKDFAGPGEMEVWNYIAGWGSASRIFSSRDIRKYIVSVGGHAHTNWTFTEPGIYKLTWQATGRHFDGTTEKTPEITHYWLVGTDGDVHLADGSSPGLGSTGVTAEQQREEMGLSEPVGDRPEPPAPVVDQPTLDEENLKTQFDKAWPPENLDNTFSGGVVTSKLGYDDYGYLEPKWSDDKDKSFGSTVWVEVPDNTLSCLDGDDKNLKDFIRNSGKTSAWITGGESDDDAPTVVFDTTGVDYDKLNDQKLTYSVTTESYGGGVVAAGPGKSNTFMPVSVGGSTISRKLQFLQAGQYPTRFMFSHPGIYSHTIDVIGKTPEDKYTSGWVTLKFLVGNETINYWRDKLGDDEQMLSVDADRGCGTTIVTADPSGYPALDLPGDDTTVTPTETPTTEVPADPTTEPAEPTGQPVAPGDGGDGKASHKPGKAASPVTLSTDTKDTVTGGTHVCAGRKLLYHGHVDGPYVSRNGDGDLTVMAVDGSEVLDSDDVCMRLGPDSFNGKEVSRMVVPDDPNLSFLGQPGTILWHAPAQLYDGWKPIWAGFGAFDPGHEWNVPDDFVSNTLELELKDFAGPGEMEVWNYIAGWGSASRIFSSRDIRKYIVSVGGHAHTNWTFTEPGIYKLTWQATGRHFDGTTEKTPEITHYWLVGTDGDVHLADGSSPGLGSTGVTAEQQREEMGLSEPVGDRPEPPAPVVDQPTLDEENLKTQFDKAWPPENLDNTFSGGVVTSKLGYDDYGYLEPKWSDDKDKSFGSTVWVEVPDNTLSCLDGDDKNLKDFIRNSGKTSAWITGGESDDDAPTVVFDTTGVDYDKLNDQKLTYSVTTESYGGGVVAAGPGKSNTFMPVSVGGSTISRKLQFLQAGQYPTRFMFSHPGIYSHTIDVIGKTPEDKYTSGWVTLKFLVGNETINYWRDKLGDDEQMLSVDADRGCGTTIVTADPSGYPALDLPGDDTTVTPTETPTTKPTAPGALDEAELPRVERLKKLWAQAVPDHVAQFGHMDLALGTTGDGITAYLHDDQIPSKSVKRPSGTFAFEVKDDTMIDVPQKVRDVLDFPDRVYELPEVQNPNIPWLGFSTLDVGRELPGGVTITLQEFDGPGDLVTGNVDFTGTINTYLDSRDPESKIHYAKPTHAHQAFWFTEPGAYHATMRYSWGIGADANHRDLSMTFLVGTTWVATGSKVVNNPDLLLQVADTTPEPDTGSTPEPVATTTAAAPGTGSETPGGGKKKEETAVEIGLLDAWAAGSKDLGPALVDTGKKAERAITTVGDFYRKWFIPTPITSAVGGAGTESSPRPAGTNGESTPETTRESTGGTSGSTPRIRRAVPQTSGNATNGARNNSFGGSVAEQDPSAPRTRHSGVPEGAEIVALPAPARGNPSGSAAVNRSTGTATTARTAADEPAADNGRATASEETAAGATPSPQQPAAAQATGGNTPVETAAAVETSSATDSWIKILLGIGVICLIAAAGVLLTVLRKL